jgi:hypothetical protein
MIQFSSILAIGFVTPAFFAAGLLLASIPIIIHILNRRRYKTVNWAAMEFLLRAMKKNRRRLKFEQWILLATRCAVLVLVATALARPMGCNRSGLASLAGQRNGLHVIVIDNSYSMAYEAGRPDAPTHLDRAKILAKELINTLQAGGESVALITASRPAAAVLAAPTYDLSAARDAVDRVQQSYGATDLLGAMHLAQEIGQKDQNPSQKNLYLITDATRSAWAGQDAEAIKQIGPQLTTTFRVSHYNLGRGSQWNQAALAVRPAGNLVTNRLNTDLLATLQSFGSGPDALLQWRLDDAVLPGGGNVRFTGEPQTLALSGAVFRSGGPHLVTAQLVGDDRLKMDNTRNRVIDVASELKVLIVEGEHGMNKLDGSGSFLELALAPPAEPSDGAAPTTQRSGSYVAPELISDLELGNKVLGDYRAVILAGVAQIAPAQADQLAMFVKNGGALIVFMGEPVVAENYNQVLLPRGLMPGTLTKRVSAASDQSGFLFDFKPHGSLHPLLSLFAGEEKSGLDTAQVFTYWQLDLKSDSKAERVMDYLSAGASTTQPADAKTPLDTAQGRQAKDPAITLHALGEGRVIVVTTTANAEWTSFPAKPSYVALMHELLAGSVGSADAWMNLSAGDSLAVPTSIKFTAPPVLIDSTQREFPLEAAPAGTAIAYRSGPLAKPGVYRLTTGAGTLPIAVNVPSDEADVRTIDDAGVKRALGDADVTMEGDTLSPALVTANATGNDFGWPFMFAGLLLVAGECFMAMRFGHYRRN